MCVVIICLSRQSPKPIRTRACCPMVTAISGTELAQSRFSGDLLMGTQSHVIPPAQLPPPHALLREGAIVGTLTQLQGRGRGN